MGAEMVEIDPVRPATRLLDDLGARLRAGALVAFPTETVYGLGASIDRPDALRRIFEAKSRPSTDPLIVHVAGIDALEGVVDGVDDRALRLADACWPGPLTMVLPRGPLVDDLVTAGGPSVAVRVPAHPVAIGLVRAAGVGIAAPSANRFGRISPTTADDVRDELEERLIDGDTILAGGPTPLGIESTVVDLTTHRPTVLRHGGLPWEDLVAVLGHVDAPERRVVGDDVLAASPGSLIRHYSPDTPLVLVEGDEQMADALIRELADRGVVARLVGLPSGPEAAARELYRTLRAADRSGVSLLLAVVVDPAGMGRGVNDRLYRAAHGRGGAECVAGSVDRLEMLARA